MTTITSYLSSHHILFAVTIPASISLTWLFVAALRQDISPNLMKGWMLCVVATYLCSRWEVTEELRQLFIFPVFFVYPACLLYFGEKISPATAFSLSFLASWSVDMTRALQLVLSGEVALPEFYLA